MKKLLLLIILAVATPLAPLGCKTAPSERQVEVKSLLVVGTSVDAAMKVAAQLVKDGYLTGDQWGKIATAHARYQQAFKLAVDAVKSDLSMAAPADLVRLSTELIAIIQSYQK